MRGRKRRALAAVLIVAATLPADGCSSGSACRPISVGMAAPHLGGI